MSKRCNKDATQHSRKKIYAQVYFPLAFERLLKGLRNCHFV